MGKSRLLAEFAHSLGGQAVTYCEGHCLAYGSATPYLPVRDLLRQLWGLPDTAAPARPSPPPSSQRLHEAGVVSEDDVPLLLQLLDVPVDRRRWRRSAPGAQGADLCVAAAAVLHASQQQPLLLAVENLHWSDPTSEEWLAALVAQLGGTAVLLLATYRPGYRPPWLAHSCGDPGGAAAARRPATAWPWCRRCRRRRSSPAHQHQAIVARAAGNPFFLEELTWTAVAHGDHASPLPLPDTIQAVLAARLDRLPPEAKRLLHTAAVIGPEVPVPLLQAIAELPEAALHRGLAHLQAAEFLYETRLFPERVYTFKHALTHEVAYGSLLQERRRVLHARIVEALEALAARPGGRAGRTPGAPCPAGRGVGQGRDLLPAGWRQGPRPRRVPRGSGRLRAGPPGPRAPARARRHQGAGHRSPPRVGRLAEHHWESMGGASPCWARPRPWPGRSTIGPGWYGCWPRWPRYSGITGDLDGAIVAGQQALELAAALGDSALQGQASHRLGQAYYAIGDFGRAAELLRWSVEAADRESGTPSTDLRIAVPGVAGADLGRARGIR